MLLTALRPREAPLHGVCSDKTCKSSMASRLDGNRQRRALQMWGRKATVGDIALELGVSAAAAGQLVKRGLANMEVLGNRERRVQENEALDELERIVWDVVARPGYKVSNAGYIVFEPAPGPDGRPVPAMDEATRLAAIGTILRIQERRARLNGIDSRAKLDVSVSLEAAISAVEILEREAARQEAELRVRAVETLSRPVGGTVTDLDLSGSRAGEKSTPPAATVT